MAFFERTPQEIVEQAVSFLSQNTSITKLSPGGKARAIIEAVSLPLNEAYQMFNINLARSFLSGASGQYLDLIGVLLGLPREISKAAYVDETTQVQKFYTNAANFGAINGGLDIYVLIGTLISTEPDQAGIVYRITKDVVLPASSTSTYIAVEAVTPGLTTGAVGPGSLNYHNFTNYTDVSNSTLLTTNNYSIANGSDIESDANYRYRLSKRVEEAEAANETSIRIAALSTPGVADVIIKRRYRGIGTVGIIVKSELPITSDGLVADVDRRVDKVSAAGEKMFVKKPKIAGLTLKTTVYYRKKLASTDLEATEFLLEENIRGYVDALNLGETLSLNRLISSLFSLSDNISAFGTTGKPVDEAYIYRETRLGDKRVSQLLLGDYECESDEERVIIEPAVNNPIVFLRNFGVKT